MQSAKCKVQSAKCLAYSSQQPVASSQQRQINTKLPWLLATIYWLLFALKSKFSARYGDRALQFCGAVTGIIFMLFFCVSVYAEQLSITIRATDGAALVSGEEKTVRALQKKLAEQTEKKWVLREINDYIKNEYGEGIAIQLFTRLKLGAEGTFESLRMPLRRAILRAELPPIELLEAADAEKILAFFAFNAVKKGDFDRLSDEEKLKKTFRSENTMVIITGTDPADEVEIIQLRR
ncbi:MAG: hypothetical protein AB1546_06530 [bacterium]